VEKVIASGETKTSVLLHTGIQADLRVVHDGEFAPALQYFTGSKEHNTALRALALRKGMRLNEYGLFHLPAEGSHDSTAPPDGQPVPLEGEADIYRALGLSPIEPELREGVGEIEAAAAGALPRLVAPGDYRGVLHCHTTWSDGTASIRDMALAALERGWEYFGVADHSEAAAYAGGVKRDRIPEQHREIEAVNRELAPKGIRVLKGCEADILADGSLDYDEATLSSMEYVVASVHSRFGMGEEEMTRRLVRAVENPHTTILGHISGRLLLEREAYRFDAEAVLARAAECGTLIEINGDPHRLDLDWRLCRRAKDLGVRFSVNPDAHATRTLAHVAYGINCARKGWLTAGDVVNCLAVQEFLGLADSLRQQKRRLQRQ
jgi:DNA polymerase (family 10)